jgi:hypothetical protein
VAHRTKTPRSLDASFSSYRLRAYVLSFGEQDYLIVCRIVGWVRQVVPNNSQSDKLPGPAIVLLAAGSSTARNDKLKDLGAIVEISNQAERLQKLSEKHHQALTDGVTH